MDSGDKAVGLVWNAAKKETCTGTLITPSIVLTAAHCVSSSASDMTFFIGTGSGGSSTSYNPNYDPALTAHSVSQVATAPGYTLVACPDSNNDQR